MVTAVTSLGRSGLYDYVIQRASAVVLALYTFFLVGFFISTPEITFEVWQNLYSQLWMKIFSLLALLSVAAHAWIGLWAVLTDYVTERLMGPKALVLRMVVLAIYAVVTVAFIVWGIEILWGL